MENNVRNQFLNLPLKEISPSNLPKFKRPKTIFSIPPVWFGCRISMAQNSFPMNRTHSILIFRFRKGFFSEQGLSESLRSSERDDLSEVYRILEDAGIDSMGCGKIPISETCPLLPDSSALSPATEEDVLEVKVSF